MSSSSSKSPPTEWTDFLHCRLDTLTLGREPDPRHRPSRDGISNHQFHHYHHHQRPHTAARPAVPVPPAAAAGPPVDQTWQPSPPPPPFFLPASFHAFPRLPAELRLAIWHHALPTTPRPPLRIAIRPPPGEDAGSQLWRPTLTPMADLAEATRPARGLLASSREARAELLASRLPHTLELAGGGLLRFDAADDIICLTELSARALGLLWQAADAAWRLPFAAPDFSSIVTLGLDVAVFGEGGFDFPLSSSGWLALLRGFLGRLPRLERVLVVDSSPFVRDEQEWELVEGVPSWPVWSFWRVNGTDVVSWYRDGVDGPERPRTIDVVLRLWELRRYLVQSRNAAVLSEGGWEELAALDVRGWRNERFVQCDGALADRRFVLYGD